MIISNEYFTISGLKARIGTEVDVKNLTVLFKQLHFTVEKYEDKSVQVVVTIYFIFYKYFTFLHMCGLLQCFCLSHH